MGVFKSKVVKQGSPSASVPRVDHHHQTADDPLGRRLIPHIIDKNAATQPDAECFQVPRSAEPRDGWGIVSWKQFADAIDTIAHGIVRECGPAPKGEFPTIAYIGPNDARYVVSEMPPVRTTSAHHLYRLSSLLLSRRAIRCVLQIYACQNWWLI